MLTVEPMPAKPRKPGRPPIVEGGTEVASARLSVATYNELYAIARARRVDISAIIREAIEQQLLLERRRQPR